MPKSRNSSFTSVNSNKLILYTFFSLHLCCLHHELLIIIPYSRHDGIGIFNTRFTGRTEVVCLSDVVLYEPCACMHDAWSSLPKTSVPSGGARDP